MNGLNFINGLQAFITKAIIRPFFFKSMTSKHLVAIMF